MLASDEQICPKCRGRCGIYKPNEGHMGTFYPCTKCGSIGVIKKKVKKNETGMEVSIRPGS